MFDNVEPRYISKQNHVRTVFTPELPDIPKVFQNDFLEGFIKHPERFPIEVRRLRFWERLQKEYTNTTDIGFNFFSKEYQKPGDMIEVSIPTMNENSLFLGKVVLVIGSDNGYEIGMMLLNMEDVPKLRIVEQICHIELYLSD
ncbi:MAG TPA: hypothetical protein DDX15_08190, partial [Gammaproteobacteria bacterium]|nr:hypothetical protein [Gammaproteobacteria bacterium]